MIPQSVALYLTPANYALPLAVVLTLRAVQGTAVVLGCVAGLSDAGWTHLLSAAGLALATELALSARRSRAELRDGG